MTLKPKTVRRLLLLGVGVLIIVGGGIGLLVVRQWQAHRLNTQLRQEGMSAFDRGDYATALDRLGRYLKRQGEDLEPDALLRYARARSRLEERDGSHAVDAIGVYRRYLSIRPDDREAEGELLRVYNAAGRFPEARDTAGRLRPADPAECTEADLPVLREEIRALVATNASDPRLGEIALRVSQLAPLELDAPLTYCDWLARADRVEEARAFADAVVERRPLDPRARLLQVLVSLGPPTPAEVARLFESVCGIAGLDPDDPARPPSGELPDEGYVLRVVALLDQIRKHDHAVSVLLAGAEQGQSLSVIRLASRRLWQSGRTDDVIRITDGLTPGLVSSPADALGFRALSLRAAGRGPEADAIREALGARDRDFRASAWARALGAPPLESATARGAAEEFARSITEHPQEPVFACFHAESLAMLGRLEDAVSEWRRVVKSPLAIGWAQPWVRIAQASLDLGLVRESIESADEAWRIAPRSAAAAIVRFDALVGQVEQSSSPTGEEESLLAFAERAEQEASRSSDEALRNSIRRSVLPGRVLVLARSGRSREAVDLIDRAAAEPLPRDTLERLAIISLREGLGREEALIAACRKLHGEAPTTAAVRSAMLHAQGRTTEAIRMLDAGVNASAAGERAAWEMTRAAFLDQAGDLRAAEAWMAAADAHPDNLAVQSAALRSASAARDTIFVERVAGRLASLAGDAGSSSVRLARARALLSGVPTARDRDLAIGLLREVTTEQPGAVEARLLLADALLIDDDAHRIRPDVQGAISELRAAAAAATDPAPIWLRVAALLQRERDFTGARRELVQLARDHPDDHATCRAAGALLAAQGAVEDAIPVYEALVRSAGSITDQLALAETLALARRDAEALHAFRAAMDHAVTPDQALALAVWFDRLGDSAGAAGAVALLDRLPGSPDQRELYRARYEAERGEVPAAIARLRAVVGSNPTNAEARVTLISLLAREGNLQEAAREVREARAAVPEEPRLAILEGQIAASGDPGGLGAFADALSAGAGAESAQVVRAVSEAIREGRLDSPEGLTSLADRFAGNLAVQNLVIRRLMELSPARSEAAARIAERAMNTFPSAAEPARLAFVAYAQFQRWDRAAACAQVWHRRDPRRPAAADAAVAQCHLMRGAPDRAIEALTSRLEEAKASPSKPDSVAVLGIAARAMVMQGKHQDAYGLLAGALPASPPLRLSVFIPLVLLIEPAAVARQWLDGAAPAFPVDAAGERAALADAYARIAVRSSPPDPELLAAAERALPSKEASSRDPLVLQAMGAIAEARSDKAAAAQHYCRALSISVSPELLARLAALVPYADGPGIVRAVDEAAGDTRDPALLLPLAAVHQSLGESVEEPLASSSLRRALELLRRVLEGAPGNAEALLRAASLADRLEENPAAVDFYVRAAALPAISPELRAVAQNNAAYLLLKGKGGPEALRRARALADAALSFERRAAFLDTAARIEVALGSGDRATVLYREAIQSSPEHVEARLGLTQLLADRGARADAAHVLDDLGALVASGTVKLSPDQTRTWEDLRARVDRGR